MINIILWQILFLFAFITVIIVLAAPEFSPEAFHCGELEIQYCIQKRFAMFSVYAAERIDIFESAILRQGRIMTDEDFWEIRNSAACFAKILMILWRWRISGNICVRVCIILIRWFLLLIDKFESLSLRIRALLLSRRAILVQDR